MKNMIAERRRYHDTCEHSAKKKSPTDPEKNNAAMIAKEVQSFAHLTPEAFDSSFSCDEVVFEFGWTWDDVMSLSNDQVTQERDHVCREVDQEHAAEPDVLIHEAHNGSCDQPTPLDTG